MDTNTNFYKLNIIYTTCLLLLVFFFFCCSSQKETTDHKHNNSDLEQTNKLLQNLTKEDYIYKKLMTQTINDNLKNKLSVSRKQIFNNFYYEHVNSDTIVIIETFVSVYSSYKCYIYTSFDKKTIKYEEEYDARNKKIDFRKTQIKQFDVLDYVLAGKLEQFIKESNNILLSPQTDFIISMFYRIEDMGDYEFSYVRVLR